MNETKFCINCGKEIPANATFCSFCGTDQKTAATAETQTDATATTGKQPTPPEHTNMWTALKLGMKQTFTWSQRITRPQYWWLYLDLVLIALILTFTLGLKVYSSICSARECASSGVASHLFSAHVLDFSDAVHCRCSAATRLQSFSSLLMVLTDSNRRTNLDHRFHVPTVKTSWRTVRSFG